jgi:Uma2 family endonuclease
VGTGLGLNPAAALEAVSAGGPVLHAVTLERDPEDENTVLNPIVLVEVLSDSTEAYDRGAKFAHYRRIPALREYVLVSQREPRVEIFRRQSERSWTFSEARAGEKAELGSLGVEIDVDALYRQQLGT